MNLGKIEKRTLSPAGKRYPAVSVVSFFFQGNTAQISYFYTQNQLMTAKEAVSRLMHWMSERQPLLLVIGESILDDLGISIGELETLCEYFEINVEMFEPKF